MTRCTTWEMMAYRAYCGASLIIPKSRYTRVPSAEAKRLPGWGSGGSGPRAGGGAGGRVGFR